MEDNVTQLIQEIQHQSRFAEYHIFFSRVVTTELVQRLAEADELESGEPQFVPHLSSSMVIIHGHGFSSFQNFPCFYQEEGRPHALALLGSIANDVMVKCEISALTVTKASRGSLSVQLKDGSCDYSFAPFHFIDPPIVTKIWPSWGY